MHDVCMIHDFEGELYVYGFEAFEVAYEDLMGDVAEVRDAVITEIAKMCVRSIHFDPPPLQSTVCSSIFFQSS